MLVLPYVRAEPFLRRGFRASVRRAPELLDVGRSVGDLVLGHDLQVRVEEGSPLQQERLPALSEPLDVGRPAFVATRRAAMVGEQSVPAAALLRVSSSRCSLPPVPRRRL
jgi:hypothetical protein